MAEKSTDYTHDIAYYAKDSRLTEPSDGKRYEWRKMIDLSKKLDRPLTDEGADVFRIELLKVRNRASFLSLKYHMAGLRNMV